MPTMTSDGLFDLKSFEQPKAKKPEPKRERGGVTGFLERAGKSVIAAPKHFADVAIVNPVKETAAQLTGNKKALANARKRSNVELGLGEKGTDFGGGVKNFIGNSAQLGANFIAPGGITLGSKIIQGAKAGAVAGGGQALANDENVVEGALGGAAFGGAAGGILGKVLGKKNPGAGSLRKNLKTQGQQMQARPAGFTSGSRVAGSDELVPQDTERMLQTLKNEGIQNTGNANTITRDVADKMKNYGKEIGDHFKVNDAPLNPTDTKKIGDNFVESLGTTDERVLNEARILAQDLQKNVKSMKDLWNFRKSLDNRIPDSKQATGVTLSNQMRAIKDMRQYIANELGEVPGMKNYHDLAEIAPFLAKGGRTLNQGAGLDFWGRILSSGPVQKAEANMGKVLERIGGKGNPDVPPVSEVPEQVLRSRGIPVRFESDEFGGTGVKQAINKMLINPSVGDAQDAAASLTSQGFKVNTKTGVTSAMRSTSGRGIPVKSIDSEAAGTAVPEVVRETITGKTPGEVAETIAQLENRGYSVNVKDGVIRGRKSLGGSGTSVFEPSGNVPVTQISGRRQIIPIKVGEESTSIIPARPRQFERIEGAPVVNIQGKRTAIPLSQQGQTQRGIINTPDVYEAAPTPPSKSGGFLNKFFQTAGDAPVLPAAAGMAATAPGDDTPQEIPPTEESLSPVDGVTDLLASDKGTDALGFGGGTPQTDSDPYSPANIQASVQSIIAQGGTQEDVAKFLSNAKVLAELTQTGKEKPLSAEAAKVVSNAQTGIRALRDFSGLIDEDPGAFGRTNIPGVGVLDRLTSGRASGALGTSSLNAARNQVIDVIARLRTGAAITNDEASRFEAFVPQPGDDPTTRAQKIDYLLNQFQMVADRSGSAGTDMQQLLGESAL